MSQTSEIGSLLGDSGLGDDALQSMQLTADTLGPAIQAGLGDITIDDINTAEVVLVTMLLDDSGSIRFVPGNTEAVRAGHNTVLEALIGAKQSASVLVSCRYLNDSPGTDHGVLYPYRTLDGAPQLDTHNYDPRGGTPLYDQMAVTLTAVATKMAEFEDGGVSARAVTAIITDGSDQHSRQHDSTSVRHIVDGLLKTEAHVICGMGIDDGVTDFRRVFADCGLLDEWILTPGNTPHEIRNAFAVVSQSAVRASQAAGSMSGLGGFGS